MTKAEKVARALIESRIDEPGPDPEGMQTIGHVTFSWPRFFKSLADQGLAIAEREPSEAVLERVARAITRARLLREYGEEEFEESHVDGLWPRCMTEAREAVLAASEGEME